MRHVRGRRAGRLAVVALCAAAAVLGVNACGGSGSSSSSGGGSGTEPAAGGQDKPKKTFTIAYSTYAGIIPFYRASVAGMREAAKAHGITFLYADSGFDPNKQVSQIEDFVTRGADLILATPGDAEALIQAYRDASQADIPVWSFINDVAKGGQDLRLSWFGVRFDELASRRADFMIERMGGCGKVLAIRGPSAVQVVRDYTAGFDRVVKQKSCVDVAFKQNAKDFTPGEGLRLAQDALTANPDPKAIWIDNDDLAVGVVKAVRDAGLSPRDVVIVSGDGSRAGLTMVKKREMTYTLLAPGFSYGQQVMNQVYDFLAGGKKPDPVFLPETIDVTGENASQLLSTCPQHPKEIYCIAG